MAWFRHLLLSTLYCVAQDKRPGVGQRRYDLEQLKFYRAISLKIEMQKWSCVSVPLKVGGLNL
jgi:hypothetical protein